MARKESSHGSRVVELGASIGFRQRFPCGAHQRAQQGIAEQRENQAHDNLERERDGQRRHALVQQLVEGTRGDERPERARPEDGPAGGDALESEVLRKHSLYPVANRNRGSAPRRRLFGPSLSSFGRVP